MKLFLKKGAALTLAATLMSASVVPASADYWHGRYWGYRGPGPGYAAGVAAGIIGLGIIGLAARDHYYNAGCHPGPLECHDMAPPCYPDAYGHPICPPPAQRCFRREYCN